MNPPLSRKRKPPALAGRVRRLVPVFLLRRGWKPLPAGKGAIRRAGQGAEGCSPLAHCEILILGRQNRRELKGELLQPLASLL